MNTLDLIVYGTTTLLCIAYVYLGIGLSRGDTKSEGGQKI